MSHSDQPKPRKQDAAAPATVEWTVSPIGEILHNGEVMATAFTYVQGKACVDAINAALDEAVDAAEQEILILRQQLAAEREKGEKQYEWLEKARLEIQQLREQLAEALKKIDELTNKS